MRIKTANLTKRKRNIEWRSHEPLRLETFSDAVFAFAVTLIIVSVEVPRSFDALFETMKGTLSFAVCFAALFQIWNNQNLFFRRYGLNDAWTVALNGMLLFVVLIYAYPLKFLSVLVFSNNTYMLNGHPMAMIGSLQTPQLMVIYGTGFTVIYMLFFFMYINAVKHAHELKLNAKEIYETYTTIYINLICAFIGITAILLAWFVSVPYSNYSGFIYCLIGPAYFVLISFRAQKARKKFGVSEPQVS